MAISLEKKAKLADNSRPVEKVEKVEKYYVATEQHSYVMPTIMQSFKSESNARTYAKILTEENGQNYIVLRMI